MKSEMSLHVLAFNFKRLMRLLGFAGMTEAVRAYVLILALQRVFGAVTLRLPPPCPENRNSFRSAPLTPKTAAAQYSLATYSHI